MVYVSDRATGRITRFGADGAFLGTFVYRAETYAPRAQLGVLPDGDLLLAVSPPVLEVLVAHGRAPARHPARHAISFSGGLDLERVGADRQLYFTDGDEILRFDADGGGRTTFGRVYGAGARDLVSIVALAARAGHLERDHRGGHAGTEFDRLGNPGGAWRLTRDGVHFADLAIDAGGQTWVALSGSTGCRAPRPGGSDHADLQGERAARAYDCHRRVGAGAGRERRVHRAHRLRRLAPDPAALAGGALVAWRRAELPDGRGHLNGVMTLASGGAGELSGPDRRYAQLVLFNDALDPVLSLTLPGPTRCSTCTPRISPSSRAASCSSSRRAGRRTSCACVDRTGRRLESWTLGEGIAHDYYWPGPLALDERGRLLSNEQEGTIDVYAAPERAAGGAR